jgi:small GTP-binding protein
MLTNGQSIRNAKVVLLGSQSVGKTSIVNRLIHDKFQDNMISTIGAVFVSRTCLVDDIHVKLEIWDTGGQEKYRAIVPMYYRDADAVVFVYDVTAADSLKAIEAFYNDVIDKRGGQRIVMALVGNKADLTHLVSVSAGTVADFAQRNGILIVHETSADRKSVV